MLSALLTGIEGNKAPHLVAVFWTALFLLLGCVPVAYAQVSVARGADLYTTKTCIACHFSPSDKIFNNINLLLAANNKERITTAIRDVPTMAGIIASGVEKLNLALYIGQFVKPKPGTGSLAVKPGKSATIDVYPLLANDGSGGAAKDSGGVAATNGANGTTSVSVTNPTTDKIAYNITYTPKPKFVGTDSVTYTISNPTGFASANISVNVSNSDPPSISTNPSSLLGTCGEPFHATITATNPPIAGYGGSDLPKGLTVDAATGDITGKPEAPGSFTAQLTATNDVGPGKGSFVFVIACPPPGTTATSMTVPLNTPTTVDLAPSITGFKVTGVSIVAAATHGTVTVNGTKVTYAPRNNYFGPDSFSFIGFGAGGTSQPAVVSVTVVGRPDPSQDRAVVGLIAAQVEAARRFSKAQISNFQGRLEALHSGGAARASADAGMNPAASNAYARLRAPANPGAEANAADAVRNGLVDTRRANAGLLLASAAETSTAEGPSGVIPGSPIGTLLGVAQNRTIKLSSSGGSDDARPSTDGGVGYWLAGNFAFGDRDASGRQGGLDFSTNGVSVGIDRRFTDQIVLGLGVGYARDKTDIGTDGTRSRAHGAAFAVYGSYQPLRNTFVDAVIGYGPLKFNNDRFVAPIEDFASATRTGNQLFGSLAAAYEYLRDGVLLSPYGRLDLAQSRLKQSTESGAGQYALTYFSQTVPTVQLALGLRAESTHETRFGLVLPRLRVEYQHEFAGERQASLAYADLFGGPRYSVSPTTVNRNSVLLGVGSDFLLRKGLAFSIDYQVQRSFGGERSQAVQVRLTQELGGSSASLLPALRGAKEPLGIQVDAGFIYDNNVTRAKDDEDRLPDRSFRLNASKDRVIEINQFTRLVLRGSLGGETFRRYSGLDRVFGELQGELRYRSSGDFYAPTFAVFGRAAAEQYRSELRDGYRYAGGVSMRQPVTDRINVSGALTHNVRYGRSAVFDATDNSARLNVDYSTGPNGTLYLTGEYRRGDVVSTGQGTLGNLDIAKLFVLDDVFTNRGLFSYRFDARTWLSRIGYNWRMGPGDSLDLSWTRAQSTPTSTAGFPGAQTDRYVANQLRVNYLLRF